jgi:hypothetical protein
VSHERLEVDREDLIAEATALVDRVELAVEGFPSPVVIGFRRGGDASVYLGSDPVYHFNAAGELRRAYRDGLLYKAARQRVCSLARRRTAAAVELLRHDLDDVEQRAFLASLAAELANLRDQIAASRYQIVAQASATPDVMARVQTWLSQLQLPPSVAGRPHVS